VISDVKCEVLYSFAQRPSSIRGCENACGNYGGLNMGSVSHRSYRVLCVVAHHSPMMLTWMLPLPSRDHGRRFMSAVSQGPNAK
jgi:hypothetical protein